MFLFRYTTAFQLQHRTSDHVIGFL